MLLTPTRSAPAPADDQQPHRKEPAELAHNYWPTVPPYRGHGASSTQTELTRPSCIQLSPSLTVPMLFRARRLSNGTKSGEFDLDRRAKTRALHTCRHRSHPTTDSYHFACRFDVRLMQRVSTTPNQTHSLYYYLTHCTMADSANPFHACRFRTRVSSAQSNR